jgi:hypothetical protein
MDTQGLLPADFPTVPVELAADHLQNFLRSFVKKDRRDRWLALTEKDGSYWYEHLPKLEQDLDPRSCRLTESLPDGLTGVCIDFLHVPHQLRSDQCSCRCFIFSLQAGKLAYYATDDPRFWLCTRKPA